MYEFSFFWINLTTVCIVSLPFPLDEDEQGGEDGDSRGPGHQGAGKGLSSEQQNALSMMKHIMLSLDEEEGLDEVYSFRSECSFYLRLCLCIFILLNVLDSYFFFKGTWILMCFVYFCSCCCGCRNALQELHMFKRIETRPMAWPCLLTIGSSLSIRIVGYKAVSSL